MSNLPEYPVSRVEQYLSNIAGQSAPLPEWPMSRVEQYLAYIIEHGTAQERLTAEELAALSAVVNEIAASISEEYDPTLTYEAGKLIRHDGKLYRANVAITTPEAWTPEHWTEVDLEDEIAAIKAALADRYTKGEADTLLAGKVSVEPQTLTDPQKAQARANINTAAPDGYYGDSGGVYQYSTNFLGKNAPTAVKDLVFRPTASAMSGTAWSADSIGGDTATIERITGKTLVWNQNIVYENDAPKMENASAGQWNFSYNGNETTATIAKAFTAYASAYFADFHNRKVNNKYYISWEVKGNLQTRIGTRYNNGTGNTLMIQPTSEWQKAETIITNNYDANKMFQLFFSNVIDTTDMVGQYITVRNVIVIDLTQMFGGAGNEPATVEEFRAMFPLDYYDYNRHGELISLNATGLKTNGFNQWDEEWEVGDISIETGQNIEATGRIRCKNFIPVFPSTAYHFKCVTGNLLNVFAYDSRKNYIGVFLNDRFIPSGSNSTDLGNRTITTPGNCQYIKVKCLSSYGGTYKNDICVNIAWSGVRNGDYEAYWQRQLVLPIAQYFPDGMKSAGTMYDELTKDKAIQRVGSRAYQEGDEDDTTVVTDGTTTYYPLETPVITPISPELNLTYKVDDFGTEKLLPENTATPTTTPMDADIVYQLDYEAQVRNNNQINISKASMDNFIASFNASGLGTIMQTYNPNTKQYEYTVTAPQPTEGGETV